MRRRVTAWVSCFGILALGGGLVACGDDDNVDNLPLNQVETAYVTAFCQMAVDCELEAMFAMFQGDVQGCVDFVTSQPDMDIEIADMVAAVNVGTTTYDSGLGADCINHMRNASCEEIVGAPEPIACANAFVGTQADGASCVRDTECAGGWCDLSDTCPGTCATSVPLSGSCAGGEKCEVGTICLNDVCTTDPGPALAGESCGERECGYGLWCDSEGTGNCQARVAAGTSCELDDMCDNGLICNSEGRCQELVFVTSEGASCGGYDDGPMCDLSLGLVCAMDMMTESWDVCEPARTLNEECLEVDQTADTARMIPCDPLGGLYCDTDFEAMTGICAAKKGADAACESSDECLSDFCSSGFCTDPDPGPCAD